MRNRTTSKIFIFFLLVFLHSTLAYGSPSSPTAYHTIQPNECQTIDTTGLVKKVDNFMIIFDPSASMTETYQASEECGSCHSQYNDSDYAENHEVTNGGREFARQNTTLYSEEHNFLYETHNSAKKVTTVGGQRCAECHQDYLFSKFNFAKDLTRCFNQNIPDLELTGALRLFGSPVYTMRSYGPKKYTKKELDHQLRKLLDADGSSPLDMTLKAAEKDWFNSTGKIAVIVISDGEDMDEREILAAEELKARYEERICIYTIQIGNDKSGEAIMEEIVQAGQCGLAVNSDTLLDKNTMVDFTKEIFLTKAEPVSQAPIKITPPLDGDQDGVADDKDNCPDTRPGIKVDEHGCWKLIVAADILFDFDKFDFKPEGKKVLDQVAVFMKEYPFLNLAIGGHTDNFGSMPYNVALSKSRAMAGLNYLTKSGVEKERLSVSWHSFSVPRATNETPEGRALNRRLEFTFSKHE